MGKYTIEIDDELLQGKVPVAFRVPTEKDRWISPGGGVVNGSNAHYVNCPRIIVEEPYVPPSWLKPGWIYPNVCVDWYWSDKEPKECSHGGWIRADDCDQVVSLCYFNFTPPTQRLPYKVG